MSSWSALSGLLFSLGWKRVMSLVSKPSGMVHLCRIDLVFRELHQHRHMVLTGTQHGRHLCLYSKSSTFGKRSRPRFRQRPFGTKYFAFDRWYIIEKKVGRWEGQIKWWHLQPAWRAGWSEATRPRCICTRWWSQWGSARHWSYGIVSNRYQRKDRGHSQHQR